MEDGYPLDIFNSGAGGDWGRSGSSEGGVLLVKQEDPNEFLEVLLPNMSAELPKR